MTFDDKSRVSSAVAIRDGRIMHVGRQAGPAMRTIDLRGATVIPGIIEGTGEFLRGAAQPGRHVWEINTARSIRQLLRTLSTRSRRVPPGEFITCFSGWSRRALAENRVPTIPELDAVAPRNPVFLAENVYEGPPYYEGSPIAITNTSGKEFFEANGVTVDSEGTLLPFDGLAALEAVQSSEQKQISTSEDLAYAAGLGLTTISDIGVFDQGEAFASRFRYVLSLWRQGSLDVRIRARLSPGFYTSTENLTVAERGADEPVATTAQRLFNTAHLFGDDVFRLNGMGDAEGSPVETLSAVAEAGWSYFAERPITFFENFKQVNKMHPLKDLRWTLGWNEYPQDLLDEMAQMGVGALAITAEFPYADTRSTQAGPPFRRLRDTPGLHVGVYSDSTQSAPVNPWLGIYYMTTGRNSGGDIVNGDQTVSRAEAIEMFTKGSAWTTFDDHHLGTIEAGKLADLVVLNADPLKVSDEDLWNMSSLMTLQAGKVVHKARRGSPGR